MKKVLVLALMLMAVCVQAEVDSNLLVNGSFESDPYDAGWAAVMGNAREETGQVKTGAKAVIFDIADVGAWTFYGLEQKVNVTAGETYELDGFLEVVGSPDILGKVEVLWLDVVGETISKDETPDHKDGGWVYQDIAALTMVAPARAVNAAVRIVAGTTSDVAGWTAVVFDDISFGKLVR